MTALEKAEKVLEQLSTVEADGSAHPQTSDQLVTMTQLSYSAVAQGIAFLRDYDPNCIIGYWAGGSFYYKLTEKAQEVQDYVHLRTKTLYRSGMRLERMVKLALAQEEGNQALRAMARHLRNLREEVEFLKEVS
jgi:hypothetical protein